MQIEKSMYGLPQVGILANNLLQQQLKPHGYYEATHTPGLWRHRTLPIKFTLVVDDFGIEYVGKDDAENLLNAIKENYEVSVDWEERIYCGITLTWNYEGKQYVDTAMPTYVPKTLQKIEHPTPKKPQHTPYLPTPRTYGKESQKTSFPRYFQTS